MSQSFEPERDARPAQAPPVDAPPGAPAPRRREVGLVDTPTERDLLDVSAYAQGLALFLATTPTPMTVSIQGAWGSGKTSTMRMVQQQLVNDPQHGRPQILTFDAWQHASAPTGAGIVYDMVNAIVTPLTAPDSEPLKRIRSRLYRATRAGAEAAFRAGATLVGGPVAAAAVGGTLDQLKKDATPRPPEPEPDLRREFATIVDSMRQRAWAAGNNPRIIVFIDDLDRLDPVQAVEVMEALKSFLDVEGCVFVLAIDFEVVLAGVQQKYPTMDARKARAFFDKIIQMPFHMPVQQFNMGNYLGRAMAEMGMARSDDELPFFTDVATLALGPNPRAIKRLINNFTLLRYIEGLRSQQPVDESSERVLFAMLALQTGFPMLYAYLARSDSLSSAVAELLEAPASDDESGGSTDLDSLVEPEERGSAAALLRRLEPLVGDDEGASASVMQLTQVTHVPSVSPGGPARDAYSAEERQSRLASSTDEAAIRVGVRLEERLREMFARERLPFSVFGQAATNAEWTLQQVEADPSNVQRRSTQRFGSIRFNQSSVVLQLEAGTRDDQDAWRALHGRATELAAAHGLRMGKPTAKPTIRFLQINDEAQVEAVLPVVLVAYRLRAAGRGLE